MISALLKYIRYLCTLFYYAWNLLYHTITVFRLFKLKTGDRWLDGFVVTRDTVGCHGDNLRCHRWRLGSLTLRSSVFFGFQCSINMTLTPDLPWKPRHRNAYDTLHPGSIKLEKFRHYHISLLLNLKAGDRRFDGVGVAGDNMSCHYDRLRCHRWRRACRSDDPLFSVLDVPVLNALFMF